MDPFINHFRSLWQGANLKREGWGLEAEAGIILATSITASVAASSAVASRLRLQPLVCNFITVNGIASGFVSLKGWSCWALLQEVGTPGSDTSRAPCQLCVRSPVLFSCLSTKESWWKMHEKMANFQRDKRNSFQIRDTISGKRQKTRLFWEFVVTGLQGFWLIDDAFFRDGIWPSWCNSDK